jgi:hypothetical protein
MGGYDEVQAAHDMNMQNLENLQMGNDMIAQAQANAINLI